MDGGTRIIIVNRTAEGCGVPANQRVCDYCDEDVWVSTAMTPAVDSGELKPICMSCMIALKAGKPNAYVLDPRQMLQLAEAGLLDNAWKTIDALNTKTWRRK